MRYSHGNQDRDRALLLEWRCDVHYGVKERHGASRRQSKGRRKSGSKIGGTAKETRRGPPHSQACKFSQGMTNA